jgi:hypothetical protein
MAGGRESRLIFAKMVALVGDGELPRTIWGLLVLIALVSVGGCSASPEPQFETAYSAAGVQIK